MGKKLSIIVPVYNMVADQKLEYCLNSLVNQNFRDYEIIAVDDCSTDDSLVVLKWYEEHYTDCFKVVALSENHRQGGAKNAGLDVAIGEFIGFIDSDDWIAPEMYEKLIANAEETGAAIVGCDYCLIDHHGMDVGRKITCNQASQTGILDEVKRKSLILNPGSLVIKIYARNIFENPPLRFPEHMFYEDNAISSAIMNRTNRFEYVEEPLYYYFQYEHSTVHTISKKRCEDRLEAMRIMMKLAKEDGSYETYKAEYDFRFISLFYVNTLFSYLQGTQKKENRFIKEMAREARRTVPAFESNPYYLDKIGQEERKLIHLQQKSNLLFRVYYGALQTWRKIKK